MRGFAGLKKEVEGGRFGAWERVGVRDNTEQESSSQFGFIYEF